MEFILTKKLSMLIDEDDLEKINKLKLIVKHGYVKIRIKNKEISLAREIMNAPFGMVVDHINGNTLDNRKCNLRICTNSQNLKNRKININNTTGAKGVTWRNNKRIPYRASIMVDGKLIRLGNFSFIDDAKKAYNNAANKYFGEFARIE